MCSMILCRCFLDVSLTCRGGCVSRGSAGGTCQRLAGNSVGAATLPAAMCCAALFEVSLHGEKELLERLDAEEEEAKADAALLLGDDVGLVCFLFAA